MQNIYHDRSNMKKKNRMCFQNIRISFYIKKFTLESRYFSKLSFHYQPYYSHIFLMRPLLKGGEIEISYGDIKPIDPIYCRCATFDHKS